MLTMKLRLTINPAYLVRDEAVLLPSMGQPGAMGQSFASTQPRVFGGEGEDPGMGGFGIAGRGEMIGMDGRGYPHNVMQRNTLLAAQAQAEAQAAAANAANVLQNVSLPLHNIARAGASAPTPANLTCEITSLSSVLIICVSNGTPVLPYDPDCITSPVRL